MKTLSFQFFLFYWMEWISTAGLGTDAILPDTDAADYYLGAYATSDGVYINPAKAVTDS